MLYTAPMVDYNTIMNCPNQNMNQEAMPVYSLPQMPPHEHLFPRGRNCAVYDSEAPNGLKFFKYHNRSFKNKSPGQLEEDLKAKLIVSLFQFSKSKITSLVMTLPSCRVT